MIDYRKTALTPWGEGYDAYYSGIDLAACPYPKDTVNWWEWSDGWNDAHYSRKVEPCMK